MRKKAKGFTLIELLIVMVILGVLATVIFILLDPAEQLARTRDTGRVQSISQLGNIIQSYRTSGSNVYPNPLTWDQDLSANGDINNFPAGIAYGLNGVSPCTTNVRPATNGTYCYDLDTVGSNGALLFTKLESKQEVSKCNFIGNTYFVYSTADDKAGTICSNGDPSPWAHGTQIYVD